MTILQVLQILQLIPGLADAVSKIIAAIHTAPGTPEHTAAVTTPVEATPPVSS